MIDVKYKETEADSHISFDSRTHKGNVIIPIDKPGRLEFTTQVSVWPNTFPYPDCTGTGCSTVIE